MEQKPSPTPLDLEVLCAGILHIEEPSLSPDGLKWVFTQNVRGANHLFTMDVNGGLPRQITAGFKGFAHPNWSPDSKRISADSRGGIWVVDVDGKNLRCVTAHAAGDSWASWFPDGRRLLFGSRRRGWTQIWSLPVDEAAEAVCLTPMAQDYRSARLSPDGSRLICFTYNREDFKRWEIWMFPADGSGEGRCLTPAGDYQEMNPEWTPDGRQIVIDSENPQDACVRLYRVDPSALERRTPISDGQLEDGPLIFSPEGSRFAYTRSFEGGSQLWIGETRTWASIRVDLEHGSIDLLEFSLDARSLYFMRQSPREIPHLVRLDLEDGGVHAITAPTAPGYSREDFILPERVSFEGSEGAMLRGVLFTPRNVSIGAVQKAPLIFQIHGGPTGHSRYQWNVELQWLLSQGYGIFQLDYRGSSGYGREYRRLLLNRWGDAEVIDMADAVKWVCAHYCWVDRKRLAVRGGSYGGYMVYLALARMPDVFRCGLATCPISELADLARQCNRSQRLDTIMQMGDPDERRAAYRGASPVYEVENIRAPLIITHGGSDVTVPVGQSELMVHEMKNQGKYVEFKYYDQEGHALSRPENRLDHYQRETAFLRKHL